MPILGRMGIIQKKIQHFGKKKFPQNCLEIINVGTKQLQKHIFFKNFISKIFEKNIFLRRFCAYIYEFKGILEK